MSIKKLWFVLYLVIFSTSFSLFAQQKSIGDIEKSGDYLYIKDINGNSLDRIRVLENNFNYEFNSKYVIIMVYDPDRIRIYQVIPNIEQTGTIKLRLNDKHFHNLTSRYITVKDNWGDITKYNFRGNRID